MRQLRPDMAFSENILALLIAVKNINAKVNSFLMKGRNISSEKLTNVEGYILVTSYNVAGFV